MTYYRRPYPVCSCSAVWFARAATAYIPATETFTVAILKIASDGTHPGNEFSSSETDEPGSSTQLRKTGGGIFLSVAIRQRSYRRARNPPPACVGFISGDGFPVVEAHESDRLYCPERGKHRERTWRGMAYRIVVIASNRSMTAAASRCCFICASA